MEEWEGKNFSITDPQGVNTVVYQINRTQKELQKDNELLSTFHKAFNKMNDKYKFQNQYDASYPHFPY